MVSPLIALMRDQVRALAAAGVAAGSLNSSNEPAENRPGHGPAAPGELRLLYVAPERLARPDTVEMLAEANVSLMAIDEAHCVSQWGHDFRPEYLTLGNVARQIGGRLQTLALTATADAPTRGDIVEKLFPRSRRASSCAASTGRTSGSPSRPRSARRARCWPSCAPIEGESGIVYCASRRKVEELAATLAEAGVRALPYHAGLDKRVRDANQDSFQQDDGVVMIATVAFGMGIDKPDVRFVCHADLPSNVEAYYQEIGRAGRDGLPADTLTLYGLDDMRLRRLQIEQSDSSDERKRIERQRLGALLALAEAPRCRRQTLLAYFGETVRALRQLRSLRRGRRAFRRHDRGAEGDVGDPAHRRALRRRASGRHPDRRAHRERGQRFNHDQLPTFGVGSDRKAGEWRSIFRQLSALGLIPQDLMEHGRWWVSGRRLAGAEGRGEASSCARIAHGAAKGKAGAAPRPARATAAIVGEADSGAARCR